jgi:glycosyltransferase involved in cell wall biosynthesis
VESSSSSDNTEQHAVGDLEQRVGTLEDRLGRIHDLVVRAVENTPRAAVELLKLRREASYADAYAPEPLITVRVGTYAGDATLFERTLNSVLRQSYANWEAVVVSDGRQESTAKRIASLGDSRIRFVQRPRNGPYPAQAVARWQVAGTHPFNEGFALARGSWIAPIDQDDQWTDDHLAVLLTAAQRTQAEVAYGVGRAVVSNDGETSFGGWPPELGNFGFQTAIHHAGLTPFLYDVNAHLVDEPADWNLARRMIEAGVRFEFVDRIVTTYYVDDDAPGIGWWRQRVHDRGAFSPGRTVDEGGSK